MSTEANSKRFFIKTLGCKVNQYESQLMREALVRDGFKECLAEDLADIYIINTCTVTRRADSESRHMVGLFHKLNPKAKIVVTGCYVEKNSQDVSFLPGVEHIVRNNDKSHIAAILENRALSGASDSEGVWPAISDFLGHTKAFIKIQDGCDNVCSYCKVPVVRGRSRSKPLPAILEEARGLIQKGFKEIVLTGICLGAWGEDLHPRGQILDVLKSFETLEGDFRIRLSSIEPNYVTDELIGYIASNDRMCAHLHIPLQSGDDEILEKMGRPYAREGYGSLIGRIKAAMPGIAITTDVMVGFPGESHSNFQNTLNLVREILPARVHIFPFSKRDGTRASQYNDGVRYDEVKRRYELMRVSALEASYLYRMKFMNDRLDVLVETKRDGSSGLLVGYSDNYIKVMFDGPSSLMRAIVPVRLQGMTLEKTFGVLVA
jgi:threonylcarbamoyladenosine tRNA methylthiotransferase MtaB